MSEEKEPRYLTAKEVADRYGLKVTWVYGCRSLPRRKVGHYVRFREDELEKWEKKLPETRRTFTFHQYHSESVIHRVRPQSEPQEDEQDFKLLFDILPVGS